MLDYKIQLLEASVLTLMLSKMRANVSLANLSSAASDCSDNESGCGNSELPARIGTGTGQTRLERYRHHG
jgi:hypothetical protein